VSGTSAGTASASEPLYATPTELSADRPMEGNAFGWLVVLELLALVLVPGVLLSRRAARQGGTR
jgi:hypothetical protein